MSEGARRGSPASSALSLLLLVAPLLAFAPATLASVPRGATALSSPSLAADIDALATSSLEHNDRAPFRVFTGDDLGDAHVLVFELSYPETRVGGLGLPDEPRVGAERSLRLEAPWACDDRSGGKASGSGEFRIFDAANSPRTVSSFGWNRLFQGREYIGVVDAYDFRARTLWPELGRFGQEDPAGTLDSANRYAALRARWNSLVDPWGLYSAGVFITVTTDLVYGRPEIEPTVLKEIQEAVSRANVAAQTKGQEVRAFYGASRDSLQQYLESDDKGVFWLGHTRGDHGPMGRYEVDLQLPNAKDPENPYEAGVFSSTGNKEPRSPFVVALACGSEAVAELACAPRVTVAQVADISAMGAGLKHLLTSFYEAGLSLGDAVVEANREIEKFAKQAVRARLANGTYRGYEDTGLTFRFVVSPNATGIGAFSDLGLRTKPRVKR